MVFGYGNIGDIQNLVDEIHKKAALWLARTFDVIILPTFNIHRCHDANGEEDNSSKDDELGAC